MPATYTLIASNTLTSDTASVTFSSIPGTYTDLVLRASARNTGSAWNYTVALGGAAGTYSETSLYAEGTSTVGSSRTNDTDPLGTTSYLLGNRGTDTANTFSPAELYIPSYTANQNKPVGIFSVRETNTTTIGIAALAALMRSTAAITTITISTGATNFAAGSSFFLYGIKNS